MLGGPVMRTIIHDSMKGLLVSSDVVRFRVECSF